MANFPSFEQWKAQRQGGGTPSPAPRPASTPRPVSTPRPAGGGFPSFEDWKEARKNGEKISYTPSTPSSPLPNFSQSLETEEYKSKKDIGLGERLIKMFSGAGKSYGGAQIGTAGAIQGLGNQLHADSSEQDRAIVDSGYSGYATDPLAASIIAEGGRTANDGTRGDGGLKTLKDEERKLYEKADKLSAESAEDIQGAKAGLGKVGQAAIDLGVNAIHMGLDAGGRALGLGMLPFASRAFGAGAQQARQEGANAYQAALYGTGKAATELATEKLFDGVAGLFGKAYQIGGKAAGGFKGDAVEYAIKKIAEKWNVSDTGKTAIRFLLNTLGEGFEEGLSDLADPLWKKIYSDEKLSTMYKEMPGELLYDVLLGMAMGGLGGGGAILTGQSAANNAKINEALKNEIEGKTEASGTDTSVGSTEEVSESIKEEVPEGRTYTPTQAEIQENITAQSESMAEQATGENLKAQERMEGSESVITPPKTETAQKALEAPKGALTEKGARYGNEGKTYTGSNKAINFRYAVVDANDLITSNDLYGNENAAYPKELQPRNRSRATNQMQVQKMAAALNPEILADNATAQNGAPIVRADGTVIGGNGRTQAIMTAYQKGKGGAYRQYLMDNAERLGIDASQMPAVPVLVRVAEGNENTDWAGMAKDLNAATTASYSATERAISDAQKMGKVIDLIVPNDEGNLNTAANKDFIAAFVREVVPETEQNEALTKKGFLSRDGLMRAEDAIFAYAYGDTELIERLAESLDNDAKNVTNMMLQTSSKAASIQKNLKRGTLNKEIDVVDSALNAVNLYLDAKNEGMTVDDYTAQSRMGQYWNEQDYYLAHFIEKNKRSTKRLREFFNDLYDAALNSGNPNQATITGEEVNSYDTKRFVDEAARKYEERTGEKFERPEYFEPDGTESLFGGFEDSASARSRNGRKIEFPDVEDNSTGYSDYNSEMGEADSGNGAVETEPAPAAEPNRITADSTNGDGEERERGHSANIRTDDFTDPVIKASFDDDPLFYYQLKNKGTLQKAVDLINNIGMDEAINTARSRLNDSKYGNKKLSPDTVPLVKITANELVKRGKVEEAIELETDLAAELTAAGQLGQSNAILRYSGASGRLLAIQKTIKKINREIAENTKKGKEPVKVSISQELIDKYNAAPEGKDGDAIRDQVIKEMQNEVAKQMPVTKMEKINAIRYTNMLGNFKTQIRNVAGNTANLARRKLNSVVKELFEKALKTDERTVSAWAGKELWADGWNDFENVADQMEGGKYDDFAQGVNQGKTIFKNKLLEKYRTITQTAMEKGDTIFMQVAYADALGGWLKANKIKSIKDASPEQLGKARAYAMEEAMKATFHEDSQLSEAFSKARYKGDNTVLKGLSKFGEAVMPFRKTPANVLSQGIEASPLGFIKTLSDTIAVKKGKSNKSQSEILSELSANVTGSALFAAGMMLRAAGKARGAGDEDEKLSEYRNQMGAGKFSIDLNGNGEWTSIDWLAPTSLPFFMGIATMDAVEGEGLNLTTALKTLSGVNSAMIEMSMLKGIADTLEDVGRATKNGEIDMDVFTKAAVSAASSYATQLLQNSLLRQAEYSMDENRQTYYSEPDSKLGKLQYPLSKLMGGGLPGDFQQQEYIDVWGRTQSNGNAAERIANNFIKPWISTKDRSTEIDGELERLYKATKDEGGSGVLPQRPSRSQKVDGETLSPYEYTRYAKAKGQKSLELATDFIKSKEYKMLTDSERAEVIKDLYGLAEKSAASDIRMRRGSTALKQGEYEQYEKDGTLNGVLAFETAFDSRLEKQDSSRMTKLLADYNKLPDSVKNVLYEKSDIRKAVDAKAAGVTAKNFFKAENGIAEARAETGSSSTASTMKGLADSGLPESEITKLMPVYFSENKQREYNVLKHALSPAGIAEFYAKLDRDGNGSYKKSEYVETGAELGVDGAAVYNAGKNK